MTKRLPERKPEAFFIGRFDEEFAFLFSKFKEIFASAEIQRKEIELSKLDLIGEPSLPAALAKYINDATVILADITPLEKYGQIIWNPNVMYELGRALQVKVPTFIMCREKYNRRDLPLPFNIRTAPVHWFEFTPEGLTSLEERFLDWLDIGVVDSYFNTLSFIAEARDIRDRLLEWPPERHTQFQVLLIELTRIAKSNVINMTRHIKSGETFSLRPPQPIKMVDSLFTETIETMVEGDSYHTISNDSFWSNLGPENKFLTACARACRRGVIVQRLVIVPPGNKLSPVTKTILKDHENLRRREENYHLRFKCLADASLPKHPHHSGICKWVAEGTTSLLKPTYEKRDGADVLIGIDYAGDAETHLAAFESEWEGETFETLDECLGPHTTPSG